MGKEMLSARYVYKFRCSMKRNGLGRPYLIFAIDMASPGRHTTIGRAVVGIEGLSDISLEGLIISNTSCSCPICILHKDW
jgi:hypothetical protein